MNKSPKRLDASGISNNAALHGAVIVNKPGTPSPHSRGMVFGMATTKVTITLPDDQLHEIRSLIAAGGAANISAFVKHAVGIALSDVAGWREMLQGALSQTGGPLTGKERAWADEILTQTPRRSLRKSRRKVA